MQHAELHTRILKELTSPGTFQWNFRESYTSLAKRLGADEEAVRITLKRATDSGLVLGWRLVVNPHLLGLELVGIQLEADSPEAKRKGTMISEISLIEGVVVVFDYHGKGLRVVLYYESESALKRKIELIKLICGCREQVPYWQTHLPKSDMKLRNIDWKIIRSVRKDPRRDVQDVAVEVGASPRTISRRLKLMTEGRVAYLIPIRNVKRSKGLICSFLIFCSESQKRKIDELVQGRLGRVDFAYTSVKDLFIVSFVVDNLNEAEELHGWIKSSGSAREVRMNIMKDFTFVDSWLDEIVERQIDRNHELV